MTVLDDGTGNDDHPQTALFLRAISSLQQQVLEAVANGPGWAKYSGAGDFNSDEWRVFFDYVPPPRATAANAIDTDIVAGKTLLGFRLPVVIASPFTRGGNPASPLINSMVFDHTSVLKLIEWRWGLAPLTALARVELYRW